MKTMEALAQEQHTPEWKAIRPYDSPLLDALAAVTKGMVVCPRCSASGHEPDSYDLDCTTCGGDRMVRDSEDEGTP